MSSPLTRWHLAGLTRRWLPDVRGSDRAVSLVASRRVPPALATGPVEVQFGPGLHAHVRVDQDGSFANFFFAQYRDPALVPILEAALTSGSVFYDVGANVGIYSLWAARLVGDEGQVFAFEPVPSTGAWLADVVAQNRLANVELVAAAASSEPGEVTIELVPHASGLSHVRSAGRPSGGPGGDAVTAPAITLDDFTQVHPPPTLVKIDVEGHEPEVVAGMAKLLGTARPAVVFEAPDFVGVANGSAALVATFAVHGYRVWSLTRSGLVPFAPDHFSHNLLALHEVDHDDLRERLAGRRFHRNQNC
ncbi:MAG: FkbM family methyltransferase [Acidimicrobiia bacterium]|nr:FkbM family methyltransferase [Acidimicrobiia bacterium]